MSKLKFVKMTGTGNDFIFFNAKDEGFEEKWKARFSGKTRAEVAQELCQRNMSVGADGLVFLEKIGGSAVRWDFYNSDGSAPKMCGNAARCAALYSVEILKCTSPLILHTGAGEVTAEVGRHREVVVSMPRVAELQKEESITVGKNIYKYEICDTGVPHAVVTVSSIANKELLMPVVERLRFPENFKQEGVNVTFVEPKPSYIKAVTFERGVEGFTQACGTGAVAARWKMRSQFRMKNDLKIQMPGGDLIVELMEKGGYWQASLAGRTHFVFAGTLL